MRLLTDPVLGRRVGLLRRVAPRPAAAVAERLDAVLMSHLHSDHADLPSLRRVGTSVPVVAPPPAARWLRRHGFAQVTELSAGATTRIGDVAVEATPAVHEGERWRRDEEAEAIGFLVDGPAPVYFAGDTDLFAGMAALAGRVDVALLPVWGWGPKLGPGHLDPERAAQAAARIRPRIAVPIHWGTLAPPWTRPSRADLARPAHAFAAAVAERAPRVEVRLLEPGDGLEVPGRS